MPYTTEAFPDRRPLVSAEEDFRTGRSAPSMTVAVVIPCYRVARHLGCLVERIGPEVERIYCVIDGCPEGSAAAAFEVAKRDVRVSVVQHEKNLGVGGAMATGYQRAIAEGADVIVKLDGDGQMDPSYIVRIVRPILRGEADYVKANRFFNLEDLRGMPLVRIVGNAGLSFASKVSSGYWNLFDPTNGYTAIHAKVAAVVPWNKVANRYFFESDLLFRLNTLRVTVVEVPIRACYGEEKSNLSVSKALVEFPAYHLRNFVKRIFYCYFLRDFNAASLNLILGLALVLFGFVFGLFHWIAGYEQSVLASAGTVMLAALPMILGWQALLAFLAFDVANVPRRPVHPDLAELDSGEDGK